MLRWLPLLLLVAACGASPTAAHHERASAGPSPSTSPTVSTTPTTPPTRAPRPTATPATTPSDEPDPRWRFFTTDERWHTSPWFAGAHRVMVDYGCNASPWYDHDVRCPGREGFHHGIDVAMPCGTPLFSAVRGVVLDPTAAGTPGAAYGVHPFRIHTGDVDVLIGHARTVLVHPGQQVHPGQRIALASDSGAPDGCHLHFEVRHHGGGLSAALDPAPLLRLS